MDLAVSFVTLEESSETCASLKAQFDDLPSRVGDVEWADGGIASAMHTFGSNWSYHREVLSEKIGEVGEKMESCITTFKDVDQKLYDELEKGMTAEPK